MEDLQNISNKLDEVKQKLTDGEYKELIELVAKVHTEKKKFVKCRVHHVRQYVYMNDGEDEIEFITSGDGFKVERRDGQTDSSLKVCTSISCELDTLIFEVQANVFLAGDECSVHELSLKNKTMNMNFYKKLKEDKVINGHSSLNDDCIIFLNDM